MLFFLTQRHISDMMGSLAAASTLIQRLSRTLLQYVLQGDARKIPHEPQKNRFDITSLIISRQQQRNRGRVICPTTTMMSRDAMCLLGASFIVLVGTTSAFSVPNRARLSVASSLRMAPYGGYNDRRYDDEEYYDDDEFFDDDYRRGGSRHLNADNNFNRRRDRYEDDRRFDDDYPDDYRDERDFELLNREPHWERPANQFSDYTSGTQQRDHRWNDERYESDRLMNKEPNNFERGRNQFSDYPDPRSSARRAQELRDSMNREGRYDDELLDERYEYDDDRREERYDDDRREDNWKRLTPNQFGGDILPDKRSHRQRGQHMRNTAAEREGGSYSVGRGRERGRYETSSSRHGDYYPSERSLPSREDRSRQETWGKAAEREGTYYSSTDSSDRDRIDDRREPVWERPDDEFSNFGRNSRASRDSEYESRRRDSGRDDYSSQRFDDREPGRERDGYSAQQPRQPLQNDGARSSGYNADSRFGERDRQSGRPMQNDGSRAGGYSADSRFEERDRQSGRPLQNDGAHPGGYSSDSRFGERDRQAGRPLQNDGARPGGYSSSDSRFNERERDFSQRSPLRNDGARGSGFNRDSRFDRRGNDYEDQADSRGDTEYRAPTFNGRDAIDAEYEYSARNEKEPAGFHSKPTPRMSNAAERGMSNTPLNDREPAGDWGSRRNNDYYVRTREPMSASAYASARASTGQVSSSAPLSREPGWKLPRHEMVLSTPVSERSRMAAARSSSSRGNVASRDVPPGDRPEMMTTGTNFLDRRSSSSASGSTRTPAPAPYAGESTSASSGTSTSANSGFPGGTTGSSSSSSGSSFPGSSSSSSTGSGFPGSSSSSSRGSGFPGSSSSSTMGSGFPGSSSSSSTGSGFPGSSSSSTMGSGFPGGSASTSSPSSAPATAAPWGTSTSPATTSSGFPGASSGTSTPGSGFPGASSSSSSPGSAPAWQSGSSPSGAGSSTTASGFTSSRTSTSSPSGSSPVNPAPWGSSPPAPSPAAGSGTPAPWQSPGASSTSPSTPAWQTSSSSPTATPATKAPWETASSPSTTSASSPPAPAPAGGRAAWSGDAAPSPQSSPAPAPAPSGGRAAWSGDAAPSPSSGEDANTAAGADYLSAMGGGPMSGGPQPKKNFGKPKPKMAKSGSAGAMGQWDPSAL